MTELHFTGNCLRGSRPILSFSSHFDDAPHLRVIKELFSHIFGVPKGARKSKPFIDHVMGFTIADGKIWVRCYEILETERSILEGANTTTDQDTKPKSSKSDDPNSSNIKLVEIGPRFVLTPIIVQESSFGGRILYENREFVSPNAVRSELRRKKAGRYAERSEREKETRTKKGDLGLRTGMQKEKDDLDTGVLFA